MREPDDFPPSYFGELLGPAERTRVFRTVNRATFRKGTAKKLRVTTAIPDQASPGRTLSRSHRFDSRADACQHAVNRSLGGCGFFGYLGNRIALQPQLHDRPFALVHLRKNVSERFLENQGRTAPTWGRSHPSRCPKPLPAAHPAWLPANAKLGARTFALRARRARTREHPSDRGEIRRPDGGERTCATRIVPHPRGPPSIGRHREAWPQRALPGGERIDRKPRARHRDRRDEDLPSIRKMVGFHPRFE